MPHLRNIFLLLCGEEGEGRVAKEIMIAFMLLLDLGVIVHTIRMILASGSPPMNSDTAKVCRGAKSLDHNLGDIRNSCNGVSR